MGYRHIHVSALTHPVLKTAAKRADMLLHDVYGMFALPGDDGEGGGCNFAITLVLLCVVDGIAREFYPTRLVKDQEKRFKKLLRDKLYWPAKSTKGLWIDKAEAALQLYLDVRNPLVHELASERSPRASKKDHNEPVVSKWGLINKDCRNIEYVDGLSKWNDSWPIMYMKDESGDGRPCTKLCIAALYWSVKRMLQELVVNPEAIGFAEACQSALAVLDAE